PTGKVWKGYMGLPSVWFSRHAPKLQPASSDVRFRMNYFSLGYFKIIPLDFPSRLARPDRHVVHPVHLVEAASAGAETVAITGLQRKAGNRGSYDLDAVEAHAGSGGGREAHLHRDVCSVRIGIGAVIRENVGARHHTDALGPDRSDSILIGVERHRQIPRC